MMSADGSGTGDQLHVLVVDDEDDVREVVSTTLRLLAGWRVTQASSGEEALALVAAEVPDVVLLDLMMPGMSGSEVAERLREIETACDVPVIMMTARGGFEAVNIIAKPFDPVQLPDRIRKILELSFSGQPSDEQLQQTGQAMNDAWSQRRDEVIERVHDLEKQLEADRYFGLSAQEQQPVVEELHGLIGVAGVFGLDEAAHIGRSAHDLVSVQTQQPLTEVELAHVRGLVGDMAAVFEARGYID